MWFYLFIYFFVMNEWFEWVSAWVSEWMNEWTNKWRNEWMNERLNKQTSKWIYWMCSELSWTFSVLTRSEVWWPFSSLQLGDYQRPCILKCQASLLTISSQITLPALLHITCWVQQWMRPTTSARYFCRLVAPKPSPECLHLPPLLSPVYRWVAVIRSNPFLHWVVKKWTIF